MSGGGGSGTQTTVQKADPWVGLQPALSDLYSRAQTQSNVPLQAFPGSAFAPMSGDTSQAIAQQEQRATAGSPVTSAMQGNLTDTLNGNYLSAGNPYFSGLADTIGNQVRRQTAQAFSGDDASFGSPAHQAALETNLTNALAPIAYQNYGDERNRQMQANIFAPQAANQDYYDIAKLAEAGGQREAYSQQDIDNARRIFEFNQNAPMQQLQQYGSILNGGLSLNGGTSSTTGTPGHGSLGAGLLGGAATGASTGAMFGPYGAAIGGVLGGLYGGLSN